MCWASNTYSGAPTSELPHQHTAPSKYSAHDGHLLSTAASMEQPAVFYVWHENELVTVQWVAGGGMGYWAVHQRGAVFYYPDSVYSPLPWAAAQRPDQHGQGDFGQVPLGYGADLDTSGGVAFSASHCQDLATAEGTPDMGTLAEIPADTVRHF